MGGTSYGRVCRIHMQMHNESNMLEAAIFSQHSVIFFVCVVVRPVNEETTAPTIIIMMMLNAGRMNSKTKMV